MSKKNTAVKASKGPSYAGYRVITLLIALVPFAVFFFFPSAIFAPNEVKGICFFEFVVEWVQNIVANGIDGLFVYGTGVVNTVKLAFTLVVPVVFVINLLLALIAVFSRKAARGLSRTVAYLGFWAYAGYAIGVVTTCLYRMQPASIDIVMFALGGLYLIYLITLGFIKVGKKTWVALLLFLLNLVVAAALVFAFCFAGKSGFAELKEETKLYDIICGALVACSAISLLFSSARLLTKKGYGFDTFRYVLQLIVFVALVAALLISFFDLFEIEFLAFLDVFNMEEMLFMLIAMGVSAAVSILQIIISAVAKGKKAKKEKKAKKSKKAKEAPVEEAVIEEPVEEAVAEVEEAPVAAIVEAPAAAVVEAPVEEEAVEEAPVEEEAVEEEIEEESPVEEEIVDEPKEVNLSKDPFIATLTKSERAKFTDTFILKIHGEMKNMPDYVVGGDNKAFFRKVFVNLGQYRDMIPTDVLNKIYKFSHKDN